MDVRGKSCVRLDERYVAEFEKRAIERALSRRTNAVGKKLLAERRAFRCPSELYFVPRIGTERTMQYILNIQIYIYIHTVHVKDAQ